MRAKDNSRVVVQQVLDRLQGRTDTLVIGDIAVFVLRDVEIAANDDLFAIYVDVFDTLFVVLHKIYLSLRYKYCDTDQNRGVL